MQIALDVIGAREQPEVGDAAQPLRERVHAESQRRCRDVVKDIVADHDVEAAANAGRVERR